MRMLPVGGSALLVEVDDGEQARATYAAIRELVERRMLAPPRDVVPAARAVLVDGVEDPRAWYAALCRALEAESRLAQGSDEDRRSAPVTIPVRYDGPDLDTVARVWGCPAAELAEHHAARVYTVAFCGFAPGFAYCTGDPPLPPMPRHDDPRPGVPAGSVGLAGEYCGIYPTAMPGGWQLVGTTPVVLFEPDRDPPARLQPGDRVRFEELS